VGNIIIWVGYQTLGPTQRSNLLTQVFLETRLKSESLEPFIAFLVFVVQKLWLKINKLIN